ncbi:major facilitator superfamily domain-containing protein [Apiospora arundinis]
MAFTIISDVTFDRWSVVLAGIGAAVSTPSLLSASAWIPLYLGLGLAAAGALLLSPSIPSPTQTTGTIATTTAKVTTLSLSQPQSLSRDLDNARLFALFPIIGTLVLVADVVVFTPGAPAPGLVEPAHLGRFFGLLAVAEQAGFLVIGLFLSGLLVAGLRNVGDVGQGQGRGGK